MGQRPFDLAPHLRGEVRIGFGDLVVNTPAQQSQRLRIRQRGLFRQAFMGELEAGGVLDICEVVSGMDVVDKLKKAPPGSSGGQVTDPDKMVKVQVASDIK